MVEPFSSFLRSKIRQYLSVRGESLRWLAKLAGVDYHKLYRLDSNELRSLSFFDARRILKVIDAENCIQILADFYPDEIKDLTELTEIDQGTDAIELALSDRYNYELYLFACETPNTNRSQIEKHFGLHGLKLLDLFLEKGTLKIEPDGTYKGVLGGISAYPENLLKVYAKANIDNLDFAAPGAFGGTEGKGLNLAGKQQAYRIITNAWHELSKVFNDPECRGNDLSAFTVFFGPVKRGHP